MSHLIEEYSRATGLRIDKPILHYEFFALPSDFDRFIVVVNSSGLEVKNYSYFDEVLWMLKPALEKAKIKIVQCGAKDDALLNVADMDLRGKTSLLQFFYLIKQASLVLSGDTSAMHIADHFRVPTVSLFGATMPAVSGPYFGDKTTQKLITPLFEEGESPSFGASESKAIDTIPPEEVAEAVGQLLQITPDLIETISIGPQYKFQALEAIPDHLVAPQNFTSSILNLRLDYGGTEDILYNAVYHRKSNIVTKTPLNISILAGLLPNIQMVIYEIDENHDVEFVKKLHHTGVPYNLISYWSNEELNKIKLQYADFHLIHQKIKRKKEDIAEVSKITSDTEFRTHKFVLSKGQVFPSKAHWQAGIPIKNFESASKIIDAPEFWEDTEFFHLFNRKSLPQKSN